MWHNLNNKYSKRAFMAVLFLLLFIMGSFLWYISNNENILSPANFNFLQNLLTALITSLVASASMVSLYLWLLPKEQELQQIREIDPQETIEYFDDEVKSTSSWGYHGHIGRWLRNSAVPSLARKAREKGQFIKISMVLIDPNNDKLCSIFASYVNTIRFREGKPKDNFFVKSEILATVVKSIIYNQNNEYGSINIKIYLSSTFSALRKDISDNAIFLTRIDPRSPALMVKKEIIDKPVETLFSMMKTDFEYTKKQSNEININDITWSVPSKPTEEEIVKILVKLNLFTSSEEASDQLIRTVKSLIDSDYHPYN